MIEEKTREGTQLQIEHIEQLSPPHGSMIDNNAQCDRAQTVTVTKIYFPVPFRALQQPPAIFVGKQELVNYGRNISMFAGPSPRILYLATC